MLYNVLVYVNSHKQTHATYTKTHTHTRTQTHAYVQTDTHTLECKQKTHTAVLINN